MFINAFIRNFGALAVREPAAVVEAEEIGGLAGLALDSSNGERPRGRAYARVRASRKEIRCSALEFLEFRSGKQRGAAERGKTNRSDWHGEGSNGRNFGKGACHVCFLYVPTKAGVRIEAIWGTVNVPERTISVCVGEPSALPPGAAQRSFMSASE